MNDLEVFERYADVLQLDYAERVMFELVARGITIKDAAEGAYLSTSKGSQVYHKVQAKLEAAARVETWLGKDTARLDYLDGLNQQLNAYHGTRYCWQVRRNHNRVVVGFDDMGVGSLTIREAIDRYQKDPEWGK